MGYLNFSKKASSFSSNLEDTSAVTFSVMMFNSEGERPFELVARSLGRFAVGFSFYTASCTPKTDFLLGGILKICQFNLDIFTYIYRIHKITHDSKVI